MNENREFRGVVEKYIEPEAHISICPMSYQEGHIHLQILDKEWNKVIGNVYLNTFETESLCLGLQKTIREVGAAKH